MHLLSTTTITENRMISPTPFSFFSRPRRQKQLHNRPDRIYHLTQHQSLVYFCIVMGLFFLASHSHVEQTRALY